METVTQNMQWSPSISELTKALSKAQGLMKGASKDKVNPHFKSKYADLASVWDVIREPLASNGLAVIQGPQSSGDQVSVTTVLTHESGEWISTSLTIKAPKLDAHGTGSAITYARRYSLMAMIGVCPDDDDDGNSASHHPQQQQTKAATDFSKVPYKGSDGQKRFLNQLCDAKSVPQELKGKIHADFIESKIISTREVLNAAIDKFMEFNT